MVHGEMEMCTLPDDALGVRLTRDFSSRGRAIDGFLQVHIDQLKAIVEEGHFSEATT
jgi:hypothetical protein